MTESRTTNKLLLQSKLTSTVASKPLSTQSKPTLMLTSTLLSNLSSKANERKKKNDSKDAETVQLKKAKINLTSSQLQSTSLTLLKPTNLSQNLHTSYLKPTSTLTNSLLNPKTQAKAKLEENLNVISTTFDNFEIESNTSRSSF
jgi:hypothetical protein